MPDWAVNAWENLQHILLDAIDGWEVWIDWYEARLKDGPAQQSIEVPIAMIPTSTWDEGPRVVNAEIRSILVERNLAPCDGGP
jgi:hypothetical protein